MRFNKRDKYGRFCKDGIEITEDNKKTDTIYTYRNIIKKSSKCSICGNSQRLEIHHKDKNRYNNNIDNLQITCRKCHLNVLHVKERDKLGRYKKGCD